MKNGVKSIIWLIILLCFVIMQVRPRKRSHMNMQEPCQEPVAILKMDGVVGFVFSLVFNPDGTRLASAFSGTEKSIVVWDVSDRIAISQCKAQATVYSLNYSPDGEYLISGDWGKIITFRNAMSNRVIRTEQSEHPVVAVAIDQGGIVASGDFDGVVRLWSEPSRFSELKKHTGSVQGIVFLPQSDLLITASRDKTVGIWDYKRGVEIRTLLGHNYAVACLASTRDGQKLASGDDEGVIKIWKNSGEELMTLSGHHGGANSIVFTPDGKYLLVAYGEGCKTPGKVAIWDVERGIVEKTVVLHVGAIRTMAISPDGNWLATGGEDLTNTVKLWGLHQILGSGKASPGQIQ